MDVLTGTADKEHEGYKKLKHKDRSASCKSFMSKEDQIQKK